jgi:hypothetical protein
MHDTANHGQCAAPGEAIARPTSMPASTAAAIAVQYSGEDLASDDTGGEV